MSCSIASLDLQRTSKGRLSYDKSWNTNEESTRRTLEICTSPPSISSALVSKVEMQRQDRARVIARVPEHARNSGQPPEFLEHTARNRTAGNRATGNRTGENTASFTRELQSSELDTRMTKSLLYQDGVVAMKYHRLERTEEGELNTKVNERRQRQMRGYQAIDEETRNTLTDAIANIQVGNETLFDDITSYLDSRSQFDWEERTKNQLRRQRHLQNACETMREGEAKRQQITEEEQKKAEEMRKRLERLEEMKLSQRGIVDIEAKARHLLTQCQHKTHVLHGEAVKVMKELEKDGEKSNELVNQSERKGATETSVQTMNELERSVRNGLQRLRELIIQIETAVKKEAEMKQRQEQAKAEAEARRKEQEEKQKQLKEEHIKQTELMGRAQVVVALPGHLAGCVSTAGFASYVQSKKKLDQVDKLCAPLRNPSTQTGKKLKLDLQKAVAHPVNAISSQSADHLRDKVARLSNLLAGKTVTISDVSINATAHPQGKAFCLEYLAKKLVLKAAQQVSAKHESAFPLAAVATAVWQLFPEVGQLLMAHFCSICPYTVPFYIPKTTDQSHTDYYKTLGYLLNEDGSVEESDQYLKRMSGVLRFYAAIIQSSPPGGGRAGHPHGVEHGWIWLARLVNLPPKPDVTATLLFDFLEVAGHALLQAYGRQFRKLLSTIASDFYLRIEAVTPEGKKGPLTRLRQFLEKCVKSGSIPRPEGYLSPEFWTRAGTPPPVDLTGY